MRRRWREYRTAAGGRPVKKFIDGIRDDDHVAAILVAMRDVRERGLSEARHLDGDIYEVRVDVGALAYRILFAPEGRKSQVLLSLDAFKKKTQKTPPARIRLAKRRLKDWRKRGERRRRKRRIGSGQARKTR